MTYALDANTISYFLRGEGNVDSYFQKEVVQVLLRCRVRHDVLRKAQQLKLVRLTCFKRTCT